MGRISSFFSNLIHKQRKETFEDSGFQITDNPIFEDQETEGINPFFQDEGPVAQSADADVSDEKDAHVSDSVKTEEVLDTVPEVAPDPHSLEGLESSLKNSKTHHHLSVGGLFMGKNSKDYEAVLSALRGSIEATRGGFGDDPKENSKKVQMAAMAATHLSAMCQSYLTKKADASSDSGKDRLAKISQIFEIANQDKVNLWRLADSIHSMPIQQQKTLTWDRILHDAREEVIEVDDLIECEPLGANAKQGDLASRALKQGVFTKRVIASQSGDNEAVSAYNSWRMHTNGTELSKRSDTDTSKKRNITARNVATSRVASLLGKGDIIAKSRTVKVHDKDSGNTITGNLMDWAKGVAGADFAREQRNRAEDVAGDDVFAREELAKASVSPKLMDDLMSLQIVDYLCQQMDRHMNNYFVQKDEKTGVATGLTGIDNDFSFGFSVDKEQEIRDRSAPGQYDTMVVDSNLNLTVPAMEKALANRILDLKPEELEYCLLDVLEDDTINAAKIRLTQLQQAIRKAMVDKPEIFVNEWSMDLHKQIMSGSMVQRGLLDKAQSGTDKMLFTQQQYNRLYKGSDREDVINSRKGMTYYSKFILSMMGANNFDWDDAYFMDRAAMEKANKVHEDVSQIEKNKKKLKREQELAEHRAMKAKRDGKVEPSA